MAINTNKFTYGEELSNAISHVAAAGLSLIALIIMVNYSVEFGTNTHIATSLVFGLSLIILYSSSGLMHWLPVGKAKKVFRKFDQIGIFILIAGTYTPFALIAIKSSIGWTIFGIEWGFAIVGSLIKIFQKEDLEKNVGTFYIIMYVIMGWVIVIDIKHVIEVLTMPGFIFLIAGGLFYSLGIIFFRMHKVKYHHLVWHIFVILGSTMHFICVYYYVLPLK